MSDFLTTALAGSGSRFQELVNRIGKEKMVSLATLAALILLTSGLAKWTWQLVQPPASQIVLRPGVEQSSHRNVINLQDLLDAHLFGVATVESKPGSPVNVPLSSLNLVLAGVVVAGENSVALISVSGQEETPFGLGEEVTHGALLNAVYPDRVILQRGGVLESLILEDFTKSLSGSVYAPPSPAAHRMEIRSLGNNNFSLPRNMVAEQLKNPDFLRDAHIVANKGGGFRVRRIKKGSLYTKLGLKRGDVIKSVNGVELNSVQDAMNQYQQLGNLSQVQIEVVRTGKPVMLQFHLQ